MIGCWRTRVRKQPIIELYFEFENQLKLYNHLQARVIALKSKNSIKHDLTLVEMMLCPISLKVKCIKHRGAMKSKTPVKI